MRAVTQTRFRVLVTGLILAASLGQVGCQEHHFDGAGSSSAPSGGGAEAAVLPR